MLCGTTSRSDRYAAWTMCCLACVFNATALVIGGLCAAVPARMHGAPPAPVAVMFMALGVALMVTQFRSWRRRVSEFEYDAGELRFRTFGNASIRVRRLDDLAKVEPWIVGRVRSTRGYSILFRNGPKAYLDFSVSNCRDLVAQIAADLQDRAGTRPLWSLGLT